MLLDKSILIQAPPEDVFAWLAPARQSAWDRSLVRAGAPAQGSLAQGARFERVTRALGHRFEMEAEAVAVEEGRLFAWRQVRGDFEHHQGAFLLERVPGGTRLRLTADVEYPYVMPLVVTDADLREGLSRDLDEALFALKDLAESRARRHAPLPPPLARALPDARTAA